MGYIHEHKVKIDPDDVHNVVDSDIDESGHVYRFIIDPITRQISHGSSKLVLTKLDHNSECFTFEIPKTIEGHDMSKCNVVEVHFINIGLEPGEESPGVYTVPGALTYDEDKEAYTFTWLISQVATKYIGTLNFAVRFACYPETEEGKDKTSVPLYAWRTAMFSGINIIDSVFSEEQAIADYSDILQEWWNRIESASTEVYAITSGGAFVSLNELIDELQSDLSDFKDSIGSNFLTEESASEKYLAKTDAEDKYQPIEDQDLGTGDTTIVGAINEVNDAVNNIITGDTAVGNAVKLNGVAASEYASMSAVNRNSDDIRDINAFLKSGDETFTGFQGNPQTVVGAINEVSQTASETKDLVNNIVGGSVTVGDANKLGGVAASEYALRSTVTRELYQHNIKMDKTVSQTVNSEVITRYVFVFFSFLSTTSTACEDYENLVKLLAPARTITDEYGNSETGLLSATGYTVNGDIIYAIEHSMRSGGAVPVFTAHYVGPTTGITFNMSDPDKIVDNVIAL